MGTTDARKTGEMLEAVFSVGSVPRLYNDGRLPLEEGVKYNRLKLGCGQAYDITSD
jgi:hypothetical protein